jgi:hypothetical protein
MAYISAKKTKEIREELKVRFPKKEGWKFSVRNEDHTSIRIAIEEAPYRFTEGDYAQLNKYYPNNYDNSDIFKKIIDVANGRFLASGEQNFDKSDLMSDYFHVGWYIHIEQGKWGKPFVHNPGIREKLNLL